MTTDTDRDNPFIGEAIYLVAGTAVVSCAAFIKVIVTQRKRSNWLPYFEDCLLLLAVTLTLMSMTMIWTYAEDLDVIRQTAKNDKNTIDDIIGLLFSFSLVVIWTHAIIRLSFLLALRRMYSPIPSAFNIRSLCDALMCIETVAMVVSTIWIFIAYNQKQTLLFYATVGMGGIGVGLDIIIFLCGLPLVWKLKDVSQKRRLQMMAVMAFGFLTLIPEIIGFAEVIRLRLKLDDDPSNHLPSFITICQTETILSILTVCLPSAGTILAWVYADRTQAIIIEPPVMDYFSAHPPSYKARDNSSTAPAFPQATLQKKDSQNTPFFTPAPFTTVDLTPKNSDGDIANGDPEGQQASEKSLFEDEKRSRSSSDSSNYSDARASKRSSGQLEVDGALKVEDEGLEEILVPSDSFFPWAVNPRIVDVRVEHLKRRHRRMTSSAQQFALNSQV